MEILTADERRWSAEGTAMGALLLAGYVQFKTGRKDAET